MTARDPIATRMSPIKEGSPPPADERRIDLPEESKLYDFFVEDDSQYDFVGVTHITN